MTAADGARDVEARYRRRRGVIVGLCAVLVCAVAVLAWTAWRSSSTPAVPGESGGLEQIGGSRRRETGAEAETRREESQRGKARWPVTFSNGESYLLTAPARLGIDPTAFDSGVHVSLDEGRPGSPGAANSLARLAVPEPSPPAGVTAGVEVERAWSDYALRFGNWLLHFDYTSRRSFTEEDKQRWRSLLRGGESEAGFPFVVAEPPARVWGRGDYPAVPIITFKGGLSMMLGCPDPEVYGRSRKRRQTPRGKDYFVRRDVGGDQVYWCEPAADVVVTMDVADRSPADIDAVTVTPLDRGSGVEAAI